MPDLTRRALVAASAALPWATAGAAAEAGEPAVAPASKSLVAFFTRSGNTKVIAGTIGRELKSDLFEIRPATPYPEDYEATVAQNVRELRARYEPPLVASVADMATYEVVFLGLPIWDTTAPPVIRSFLHRHDLRGKTLRPFITHGGYGIGDSLDVLRAHAPGASLVEPFVMEADQERRTLTQVRGWLAPLRHG